MSKDLGLDIVGPVIKQGEYPTVKKAENLLSTMSGKKWKYDQKYVDRVSEIGQASGSIITVPFRGKTYTVRKWFQRDGLQGVEIVKGGTPKSRQDFRQYIRKSLNMRTGK